MTSKELARALKNIGPVMAKKMLEAGIESPEQLRKLGAVEAYRRMYRYGDPYGDHNAAYLHALEGAIRDCDWKDIPDAVKEQHKRFCADLQVNKKSP